MYELQGRNCLTKKSLSSLCPFCAAYPSISAHYTSIYLLRYLSGVSNFNMLWILMCIPSIIVRRVITKSSIQWHRWYHQSWEIAFSSWFVKLLLLILASSLAARNTVVLGDIALPTLFFAQCFPDQLSLTCSAFESSDHQAFCSFFNFCFLIFLYFMASC